MAAEISHHGKLKRKIMGQKFFFFVSLQQTYFGKKLLII